MTAATTAKSEVEDAQRELAKQREASGEPAPEARFFMPVGDKWMPKIDVDTLPKDPEEMADVVRKWIYGDKAPTRSTPVTPASALAPAAQGPAASTSTKTTSSSLSSSVVTEDGPRKSFKSSFV